jgi:hypothetical protein
MKITRYFTVRETFTVLVSFFAEFAPFMVSVKVPRAEEVVFMESFVDPEVVIEDGENEALLPDGSPDAVNATAPVYPLCAVTVMLYVAAVPFVTVFALGDALSAKDCAGAT